MTFNTSYLNIVALFKVLCNILNRREWMGQKPVCAKFKKETFVKKKKRKKGIDI